MPPRVRAMTRSRWELRSFRARRYASACMREIPRLGLQTGQARSRSSNRRNANNNAAPLYNTQ